MDHTTRETYFIAESLMGSLNNSSTRGTTRVPACRGLPSTRVTILRTGGRACLTTCSIFEEIGICTPHQPPSVTPTLPRTSAHFAAGKTFLDNTTCGSYTSAPFHIGRFLQACLYKLIFILTQFNLCISVSTFMRPCVKKCVYTQKPRYIHTPIYIYVCTRIYV